jgi:hypothetical protein
MAAEYKSTRKHPRKIFTTTIEYTHSQEASGQPVKGVTVNISSSGLCLYAFSSHAAGDKLRILKGTPMNLEETAIVRWVKKINPHLYKIGCEFTLSNESE